MRVNAVKKMLRLLAELAESDPDKYATLWKEFGVTLKEGIADDYSNRDEIAGRAVHLHQVRHRRAGTPR